MPGAMRSRTICLSSLISGNRPFFSPRPDGVIADTNRENASGAANQRDLTDIVPKVVKSS